jgi:hypothetical protein
MAAPVTLWIAQLCSPPAAIAVALPEVPFTDGGGDDWPALSYPQQIASLAPLLIAQLWYPPAVIAVALPEVPFTEDGGAL